jgi:hypothetical protein
MEAVAFGGRDVTNSAVNDWNNIQFGTRVDTTNKVAISIKNFVLLINLLTLYTKYYLAASGDNNTSLGRIQAFVCLLLRLLG